MSSVLESVEWGKPALSLLSQCKKLDPNLPAVMQIRHTERLLYEPGNPDNFTQASTERGKKAAYEFGTKLPRDRQYRLYHTYIERTKETSMEIKEGIASNNGRAEIIGSTPLTTVVNREKHNDLARKESELGYKGSEIVLDAYSKWVTGHFPPWVRVPALDFSQRGAAILMDNLDSAEVDVFDVYVSHDIFIAAFLFHWFGVYPSDWVSFLDGFILQLGEERIHFYTKNGKKETYYPHWWNF